MMFNENCSCKKKIGFFTILTALTLMILLQGVRELIEYLISPYIPDTRFAGQMLTMCVMIVLTGTMIVFAKFTRQELSVFPKRFSKRYIIASCVVIALYIAAPSNYIEGLPAVFLLLYGSAVTPIYEELLFRGIFWNWCEKAFSKEISVYFWNVFLFTVWHIGYMIPNILISDWNAVLWKLAAGFGYGIVIL